MNVRVIHHLVPHRTLYEFTKLIVSHYTITVLILLGVVRLPYFESGWRNRLSAPTKPRYWQIAKSVCTCACVKWIWKVNWAVDISRSAAPGKSISAYRLGLTPASFTHNALGRQSQWIVKWEHLIQINQLVKTTTVSPASQTQAEQTTPTTVRMMMYQIFPEHPSEYEEKHVVIFNKLTPHSDSCYFLPLVYIETAKLTHLQLIIWKTICNEDELSVSS
jgi:hypothetical protein